MHSLSPDEPTTTTSTTTRRRRRTRRRIPAAIVAGLTAVALVGVGQLAAPPASAVGIFDPDAVPAVVSDSDVSAVELGVTFSSSVAGSIGGIRFYKGPRNTGTHVGSLWSSDGALIERATFVDETASGWQTVAFDAPVAITAGTDYTASYLSPNGRYSADEGAFAEPVTSGPITVPASGGVYTYGGGDFPTQSYLDSNYYVDVLFTPEGGQAPNEGSDPAPVPTPTPTAPAPDPSVPSVPTDATTLDLPRIPWEGGSAYYAGFEKPAAAGWSDPSFFPIATSYNNLLSETDADYDRALGLNTYWEMWEGVPYSNFEDNGMYWVGNQLNSTFDDSSVNWVGDFLDDEVDGRFDPDTGFARLQSMVDDFGDDGRFKYANFTHMVIDTDTPASVSERYVNQYTDVVSIDRYFYTIPYCDWAPYRDVFLTAVDQSNCRTASTYGKAMNSLRIRDAADGQLQPLWNFVELYNGGGTQERVAEPPISGGQLQGAVMNSIINEARGIVYFNQSMNGSCISGGIIREVQKNPNHCGASQVAAMGEVNNRIHDVAPVLNTQSYEFDLGPGIDGMVKAYDGYAYIFAMVDGSSSPGARTVTLPTGVSGSEVEVLWENRTLPATGGSFGDSFDAEYSYHVYRVKI
jgi:hypothetical protein